MELGRPNCISRCKVQPDCPLDFRTPIRPLSTKGGHVSQRISPGLAMPGTHQPYDVSGLGHYELYRAIVLAQNLGS
jgi:hypothetical protein